MGTTVSLVPSGRPLTEDLAAAGYSLDLRCGGEGLCGRCRVTLLSGAWQVAGERVEGGFPRSVPACRCRLLSASGEVEIPDGALAPEKGCIVSLWESRPLPATDETVVGVDLGTTTVAAVLVRGGRVVDTASAFNGQTALGDNVISRISFAARSPRNRDRLRKAVLDTVNGLVRPWRNEGIRRIGLAGNTVMTLLFLGIDPSSVGVYPFEPASKRFPPVPAVSAGLEMPGDAVLLLAPASSGYIGGDLVSGYAELAPCRGDMLVDIGTNCEMMFHTSRGVVCAAAAAGPAFEGASVACGSRAVPGAVDKVEPSGRCRVIGGGPARSICGSGMVDFLAVWREAGRLNGFGRLEPPAPSAEVAPGVVLTEGEIESLLKAKAAVASGIVTLEAACGEPVRRLLLAGGFALHLDCGSARRIGMLPDLPCRPVGNTSLAGAVRLAADPEFAAVLDRTAESAREISLNGVPGFEDCYIDSLMLP